MVRMTTTPVNMLVVSTAPAAPAVREGDLYYDSAIGSLQIYNGQTYVAVGQPLNTPIADHALQGIKLTVASRTGNMVMNGSFEDIGPDGMPVGWLTHTSAPDYVGATYGVTSGNPIAGARSLTMVAATGYSARVTSPEGGASYPAFAGDLYHGSVVVSGSAAVTNLGAVSVRLHWYDVNGGLLSTQNGDAALSTTPTRISVTGVAPTGTHYVTLVLLALPPSAGVTVTWDGAELRRAAQTELRYRGDYSGITPYAPGDVARYSGHTYVNVASSTGKVPINTLYWQPLDQGLTYYGAWMGMVRYAPNTLVTSGGNAYVSKRSVPGMLANLVTNPRAATATGWGTNAGSGGVAAQTLDTGVGGPTGQSYRLTWTTGPGSGQAGAYYTNSCNAGYTYLFRMSVRSSAARSVVLQVEWYDANGARVGSATVLQTVALAANTWTDLMGTATVPTGAVSCNIETYATTPPATNDSMWFTAAMMVSFSTADNPADYPYFDGTTSYAAGASWNMNPDASVSTLNVPLSATDYWDPLYVAPTVSALAWTTGTLAANWINYGQGTRPYGYARSDNRRVSLRGVVQYNGTAALAPDVLIATLPSGYRPAAIEVIGCSGDGGFAEISIDTAGTIRFRRGTSQGGGAKYLSLNNISFQADGG